MYANSFLIVRPGLSIGVCVSGKQRFSARLIHRRVLCLSLLGLQLLAQFPFGWLRFITFLFRPSQLSLRIVVSRRDQPYLSSQSSSSARITIRRCTAPAHGPSLLGCWRVRSRNGLLRCCCDRLWGLVVCAAAEGLSGAREVVGFLLAEAVAHYGRILGKCCLGRLVGGKR